MNRYFKYGLLVIFVATVLLIVFLQFNSNRSIDRLIDGNENMLSDFAVKENLQHLTAEIIALESKVRGSIIGGSAADTEQFRPEIDSIHKTLQQLVTLAYDEELQPLISSLQSVVDAKMKFSNDVLQTYRERGKPEAERLVNDPSGKLLADTIKNLIHRIDELHQQSVTDLIKEADSNGRRARTMGTILALIAVLAAIFTFTYVVYKVRQQQKLIARLNRSEKEAKEAARIKENFLANMSHEIRTPLNAILGFADRLQNQPLDQQSLEQVQTIRRSGENLLSIVDEVLDLSKIEAGMMRIESAPFSVRSLLHSVEMMFRSRAEEKKLQLHTVVDDDVPDILEGDDMRFAQILVNLVNNALKFTQQGSIDVRICNKGIHENRISLAMIVQDTGIGIKKEKLDTIFERFRQAEDSVTRKYGGTGLGLAIVQELVRLQQGNISVDSAENKGTTFTVTISYLISESAVNKRSTVEAAAENVKPLNLRVLIVEDNIINQSLLKLIFTDWKIEFDTAANGAEALALLAEKKFSLVLMDIQMPIMDGYTAARAIRQDLKLDIPIIAMTAHAMAGEREKCLGMGMNEYISKPIREEQLYRLIQQFTNAAGQESYRYINLDYMREISKGNREYEKTVTEQFIEIIPQDLEQIQSAWQDKNVPLVRQVAHSMKTSVSVMGLNTTLDPYLEQLENNELDDTSFNKAFSQVKAACHAALDEARRFYAS